MVQKRRRNRKKGRERERERVQIERDLRKVFFKRRRKKYFHFILIFQRVREVQKKRNVGYKKGLSVFIGQQGMESFHRSTRDGEFSLVYKGWKVSIGLHGMESFHWSTRKGDFSMVNKR